MRAKLLRIIAIRPRERGYSCDTYAVIDADTLADSDLRRGYGTPTVSYDNRDLFGMPEPTPPIPSPT
jgi:hypothetical protein